MLFAFLVQRGARHAPARDRPPRPGRGAALPGDRRPLPPRGRQPRPARSCAASRSGGRARRVPLRRARALPAARRRPGPRRAHLDQPVRSASSRSTSRRCSRRISRPLMRAHEARADDAGAHRASPSSPLLVAGCGGRGLLAAPPADGDAARLPGLHRGQPRLHGAGGRRPHRAARRSRPATRSTAGAAPVRRSTRPCRRRSATRRRPRSARRRRSSPNLKAAQQRPEQIAVLKAQEERAQATLDLSRSELERQRDAASARHRRQGAARSGGGGPRPRQGGARGGAAGRSRRRSSPAGPAEIEAAEAAVRAAEATLRQAETQLAKRRVDGPGRGARAGRLLPRRRGGERRPAGARAAAADEPARPLLRAGAAALDAVASASRSPSPATAAATACAARITFISREAEFTPPVIFSRGGAGQARLPGRGDADGRGDAADRPAGQRPARRTARAGAQPWPPRSSRTPASGRRPTIVIDVEGLTKSFGGRTVVRDLTMQVRRGLIYGFLGPNGSGKTTTIRMLCGLLTPDAGRGTCLGYDILHAVGRDQAPRRLHDAALLALRRPHRSARTSNSSPASTACRSRARAARAAIARLGLEKPRRASSPASSRAAGSSGSRSAPASCRARSCSCSTSRRPASTRRRGATSGTRSTRSRTRA